MTFVRPSPWAPLSLAGFSAGADGAAGGAVSIVTESAAEVSVKAPLASVSAAVMLCTPSLSAAAGVIVPIGIAPSRRVIVAPGAAVPVNTGRAVAVTPSVLDVPVSEPGASESVAPAER